VIKIEYWDKFLEEIADKFALKNKYKEIFLVRFAYKNQCKPDEEIWQLAKSASREAYKKQMTFIYSQFANLANGCICLRGSGAGKFEKLRIWLEEKYSDWLILLTPNNYYYIERSPIESDCYDELLQTGAFLRIKAPRQMGKTWLLEQVLTKLKLQGYQTLRYDFGLADRDIFSNYGQFAYKFCAGISNQLELPDCLEQYWSQNLGFNQNITYYFKQYLLKTIDKPFVLAFDCFDCVFEYEKIAIDFCKLLRGWHERAQERGYRGKIWRQLRLVVIHSTDVYSNLNINSSPLAGVGKVISLPEFTLKQVRQLAEHFQLDLTAKQIDELMNLTGGHPYLITESFKYLTNPQVEVDWQEFLKSAPTDASPFGNHLRQLLWTLKQHPGLATALTDVVCASEPIPLQSDYGFKLLSMGLVNREGNNYYPKLNLYHQYFLTHLDEIN
jgi:hypothetical protein